MKMDVLSGEERATEHASLSSFFGTRRVAKNRVGVMPTQNDFAASAQLDSGIGRGPGFMREGEARSRRLGMFRRDLRYDLNEDLRCRRISMESPDEDPAGFLVACLFRQRGDFIDHGLGDEDRNISFALLSLGCCAIEERFELASMSGIGSETASTWKAIDSSVPPRRVSASEKSVAIG